MSFDFLENENKIIKFWKEKKILEKYLKRNKGKTPWSFIDGPITANNPMGVHHGWGRTYKDIFQRFYAMKGYDERFQNGFDCQGLHVEVGVEKGLDFNSKRDIENYGLDNFSKKCRESVNKFAKIQTRQSQRLGQFMDWKNSYYTMSGNNIVHIWHFLKKCHKNGWIYKGTKVLPWCVRCGTSSSQHEMSDEGYREITHKAVFVKAPLKGRDRENLLVWTTTEWTLPSNVAAAVNPENIYVKAEKDGEVYYLSKETMEKLGEGAKVLEEMKGSDLVGLEYETFFPKFAVQEGVTHKIIPWSEAGAEEGTGIVHIAPTCGQADYELGKKENLPLLRTALDGEGIFSEGFGWLTGKYIFDAKPQIIENLREKNILFKTENFVHRYPICWRCKEELVFRMGSEWFISSEQIRPLMKRAAEKVNWVPKHTGKLMLDWLDNMGDWNISRKRFWGLPLMFYECSCGNLEVIGSLKELKEKAIEPKKVKELPDLHRPWIDEIKIKCPACGKEAERIPEVGDCWLDAGIVPFSTLNYLTDKNYWNKWFPANLVIEMRAQVRLWFYSLLFMSVTIEGETPYKNVFAYETVTDEEGEEMHKSKGNAIWFDDAIEKMGADVMRWLYARQNPKYNLRFGYNRGEDIRGKLLTLANSFIFFHTYSEPQKARENADKEKMRELDRWIISKLNGVIREFEESVKNINLSRGALVLEDFFINALSLWYIRRSRKRFQNPQNEEEKKAAEQTLFRVLFSLTKILAPVIPYFAEDAYQKLKSEDDPKSVHLADFPKFNEKEIDKKLEEDMEKVREIANQALHERKEAGLKIRQPLSSLSLKSEELKNRREILDIIKDEVNVENIVFNKSQKEAAVLDKKITPELKRKGDYREIIRQIQSLRKKAGLLPSDKVGVFYSREDKAEIIEEEKEKIKKETNLSEISFTENFPNETQAVKNFLLNGKEIKFWIKK